MKYFLFVLLFIPLITFAQQEEGTGPFVQPQTLDEAKGVGEKILGGLPEAMGTIWKNEVAPIWAYMFSWAQDTWNRAVGWRVEELIERTKAILAGEIEKKSPIIQQEFEKKKQETIQEIQGKESQDLLQRFLDLFKK
ncbi:MAG: hypothetical protein Q7S63_02360 [bacterium]|nr:hypothetical protein [bacterium]